MAKVQTRRGISLNRDVFEALCRAASQSGVTATQFVTDLIRSAVPGAPKPTYIDLAVVAKVRAAKEQAAADRAASIEAAKSHVPKSYYDEPGEGGRVDTTHIAAEFRGFVLSKISWSSPKPFGVVFRDVTEDWGDVRPERVARHLRRLLSDGRIVRTPDGYLRVRGAR
jgi:hypothetical protein